MQTSSASPKYAPAIDEPQYRAPTEAPDTDSRQRWMAILARSDIDTLETAWKELERPPAYTWLRRPETGLVMLRARIGGSGAKFNLGEASVTRCTLRTASGFTGVSYLLGRSHRHAELAALFDALLQDKARCAERQHGLIARLAATQAGRRDEAGRKAAATKVDFYTIVRGENP